MTFLMTSITMIALIGTLNFDSAYATLEPAGCSGNSVNPSIKVFRNDGVSDVQLTPSPNGGPAGTVDEGEMIKYFVQLDQGIVNGCNYLDGTLNLLLPNATQILVVDPVPLISNVTSFNATIPYQASIVDDVNTCVGSPNDGRLNACLYYGDFPKVSGGVDGISHSSAFGEDFASGSVNIQVTVVGNYTVSTSSDPQNTTNSTDFTNAPVIDPTDIVRIDGVNGIQGTFNVTSILNTPSGQVNGTCDAPIANSTFPQFIDCSVSGSFEEPGDYCWDVTVDDVGMLYTTAMITHNGTFANNECFRIAPSFSVDTLSNSTGVQSPPVINPSDIVSINGTDTFFGNFTTVASLIAPNGTTIDTPTCTTVWGDIFPLQSDCTMSEQVELTEEGQYCWDVTVTETSGNYTPSQVFHNGTLNSQTECFVISPKYDVSTLSNVTDSVPSPVVDPTDVVSISGTNSIFGNFTAVATLNGPSGSVDAPTCSSTSGDIYPQNVTCSAIAEIIEPGQYCWDVTVTETSGNYTPSQVFHNGTENSETECFNVLPDFSVDTLSNSTGVQSPPVINPSDIVSINGTDTFFGNFTTVASLIAPNGTTIDTPTCTTVWGDIFPLQSDCTMSEQVELTEEGQYCWDVTVTETSGNYTPSQVFHNGTLNSQTECFEIQTNAPFNATTSSTPTGIVGPTINPSDLIIINGTDGLFGNFTGNATLIVNSTTSVAETICSYVNGTEYPLEMECGVEIEIVEPGQYCWDVTITEITGNYTPSVLTLFGIDDAQNECFNVFEGLTPGFWKNNAESWNAGAWFVQNTTDSFHDVFGVEKAIELRLANGKIKNDDLDLGTPSNSTLYGALGARGGDENALARHCVAAKLNVENPDVTYPLNYTEVITQCGETINSGNVTAINDLKDILDEWNNFGANISQHWPN